MHICISIFPDMGDHPEHDNNTRYFSKLDLQKQQVPCTSQTCWFMVAQNSTLTCIFQDKSKHHCAFATTHQMCSATMELPNRGFLSIKFDHFMVIRVDLPDSILSMELKREFHTPKPWISPLFMR